MYLQNFELAKRMHKAGYVSNFTPEPFSDHISEYYTQLLYHNGDSDLFEVKHKGQYVDTIELPIDTYPKSFSLPTLNEIAVSENTFIVKQGNLYKIGKLVGSTYQLHPDSFENEIDARATAWLLEKQA